MTDPKFYTTLARIREHDPCIDGWKRLLRTLGKSAADNEPLHLMKVLDSNGLDDALWCLRACSNIDREARLFAVWCARQVQHLMTDPRSIAVLDVAESYADGLSTRHDLDAARNAAGNAAGDAAGVAAWVAAEEAAWDAVKIPAKVPVWAAARAAAWDAQEAQFRRMLTGDWPGPKA